MAELAKRDATYADLQALPPNVVGEIIHGALVTHPRPAPRHSAATFALGNRIGPGYQDGSGGPGGWVFFAEPELHLGSNVVVPDIAGWRRERLNAFPDTAYVETNPDWVCEVLSEATEQYDRNEKRRIYGAAGVTYLWLLDPRGKFLEVFQFTAGHWLLSATFTGKAEVRAVPFDKVSFWLSQLWPLDPPDAPQEQA
jgi:Uma2 family endonuclease